MANKKNNFKNIAIVGVGLMGGSLGLAIKKKKLAQSVIGVTRHKETIRKAFAKKVLDVATLDLADGVSEADLVILCAPVSVIADQLKQIAPFLKKDALVIDVGSSKASIEKVAQKYLKKNVFVACHPMAGSEHTGVEYASADLFDGAVCFLTKPNQRIEQFWKSIGAIPIVMDAHKHDAWVSKASHLPHVLAFSLFQNFGSSKIPFNPSLRGFARLAQSNPELWSDILLSNREEILKSMRVFNRNFSALEKALSQKNPAAIKKIITHANQQAH